MALGADRVESIYGQLAQALQAGAFAIEPLEQERGVRNGELVLAVRIGCIPAGSVDTLSRLLCHLPATGTGQANEAPFRTASSL